MPNFFDIKLKNYIYSKNYRNLNFKDFIESTYDYMVSSDQVIESIEKSVYGHKEYMEFIENNKKDEKLDFIFFLESKLLEVLAKMEYI
jgi:hypothetical protein